ncbi:MAG: cell wall hydrolase [Lachnospiraceae bacterium]|nr:cell wall hydrolase [Lachnospiraceae bacterium]
MKLEKVKKLRKGLVIAVVAGVVVSQAAPAIHSGTRAHAGDENEADDAGVILQEEELLAEENAEDEPELQASSDEEDTEDTSDETVADGSDENADVTTPEDETDPVDPTADPTTPEDGTDPADPAADPTDPTTPEDGTDPVDPTADPTDPTTPEDGTDVTDPTTPEDGTDPADPTEQTEDQDDAQTDDTDPAEQAVEIAETDSALKAALEAQAENEAVTQELAENPVNAPASYEQDEVWYPVPSGELVPSPVIYRGFRFWTVAKDYAFATADINILEEKNSSARAVGTLSKDALCYVLKSEDGWYYVESGAVRGFVQTEDLAVGEDADALKAVYEGQADIAAEISGTEESIDTVAPLAEELISKDQNAAFDYYRATVYQTVVEKDYALPEPAMVNIREDASESGRIVGVLGANGICYVIADRDNDWVYVESGDVRGFVKHDQLVMADTAGDDSILTKDEEEYATASESIKPEENRALYYTLTSIRSGVPDGMERSSILQYASEFIGNPYVWGGTSLTNGADCSGFVQSIFAQYGYSLPRTAAEQSQVGEQIAVEDAQPGDLIFYGRGGHIYHVVIYAGDGQTIEAKSRRAGIVASEVSYNNAVWAVRILDEDQATQFDIPDGLGSVHSYMGWQKVTMKGSQQYAFRESAGMAFDPEGFGVVDNRYVIACTTTFGNIGDYVDFYQEDGSVIPCIIGDFKNQNDAGCNAYGHLNGDCIIEFVVDQNSWYHSGHANPGTASCHPEWSQDIVKAVNVGSFYD